MTARQERQATARRTAAQALELARHEFERASYDISPVPGGDTRAAQQAYEAAEKRLSDAYRRTLPHSQ
jgi:hypothetical protein